VEVINEKHQEIEDAFEILGKLNDSIDILLTFLRSMRIISRDLEKDVKKSLIKFFLLRKKQRRRNELLTPLYQIKKLKDGLTTIKQSLTENDFSSAFNLIEELSSITNTTTIVT